MGLKIQTLYDANTYLNGENYYGRMEEVTLPDLKWKMTDHKAMGMGGAIELPAGNDKMEMKLKLNSLYESAMTAFANPYVEQLIILRGNVQVWEGNDMVGEKAAVAFIRGKSKGLPPIGLKHQDNPDLETTIAVTAYKLEVDGVELFDVDYLQQKFVVDGVDLWAQRRANLGI